MTNQIAASFDSRFNDYAEAIDVGIRFVYQPLVSGQNQATLGHEALVRGLNGESAHEIIAGVHPDNLFFFDQACRMRAIQDAGRAGLTGNLHLNCTEVDFRNIELALQATAHAVAGSSLAAGQVVLEFASLGRLGNPRQLSAVRQCANALGFRVLADNFGSGEAGLKRLAVMRPEFVKLDRELVAGVHGSPRRQAMVLGILAACAALGIRAIAAGVERAEEVEWLTKAGVEQFQGYHFCRPQAVPEIGETLVRGGDFDHEIIDFLAEARRHCRCVA